MESLGSHTRALRCLLFKTRATRHSASALPVLVRSRHDEKVPVSPRRLRIQPSSPPPNHPNNHLFRQPNSSPPPVSGSVLQPHGKRRRARSRPRSSGAVGSHQTSGHSGVGVPGLRSPPQPGPVPARFAGGVEDSPSGSKGRCYRELARSRQLERAAGFLVTRPLLIAPRGGEEGLVFLGLCKSLSAPLCFSCGAGGSSCDLCPLAQREGAAGSSAPRHAQTRAGAPAAAPKMAAAARGGPGPARSRVLRVSAPCRCRLPVPVPRDAVPQHDVPAVR